jgi:hypothetical protein
MERQTADMRNGVLTILLLALLLITLTAPFSGLALLMLVLFVSAFLWASWTLLRTLIIGDVRENS